jgi:hypothetical protein
MKRRGISLLEVILAAFVMAVALGQLLWSLSYANRSTMDVYYENLALTLAREPLEIFKGKGYVWARQYKQNPTMNWYPLGEFNRIRQDPNWLHYPNAAEEFSRKIEIVEIPGKRCLKIKVQVVPVESGKVAAFLSRKAGISVETLLFEPIL